MMHKPSEQNLPVSGSTHRKPLHIIRPHNYFEQYYSLVVVLNPYPPAKWCVTLSDHTAVQIVVDLLQSKDIFPCVVM